MIPNLDPRALKNMMDKLGIKSREIKAVKVVIEGVDNDIVIENPQVTMIEMQGQKSFQITGNYYEREKSEKVEISNEDIEFVSEQSGVSDKEKVKKAIEESKGDLAQAIILLKEKKAKANSLF